MSAADSRSRSLRRTEPEDGRGTGPYDICSKYLNICDWHFAECPEDERRACFYYEYLRGTVICVDSSSAFQCGACDELHKLAPKAFSKILAGQEGKDQDRLNEIEAARLRVNKILRLPPYVLEQCYLLLQSPWPQISWQRLDWDERKRRKMWPKAVANFQFDVSPIGIRQFAELREIPAINQDYLEVFLIGSFRQSVFLSDIVDMFKSKLCSFAKQRPGLFEKRDQGKAGYGTKLSQLGALRLYCLKQQLARDGSFTEKQLRSYMTEALSGSGMTRRTPSYGSGELRQAAGAASSLQKRLFARSR